jgi:hypothetical protein
LLFRGLQIHFSLGRGLQIPTNSEMVTMKCFTKKNIQPLGKLMEIEKKEIFAFDKH